MLGASEPDPPPTTALRQRILDDGEPFWLVEGLPGGKKMTFAQWMQAERVIARVRPMTSSATLPRNDDWPEKVTLSWVEPPVAR